MKWLLVGFEGNGAGGEEEIKGGRAEKREREREKGRGGTRPG